MLHIVVIKVEHDFDYRSYLHLFNQSIQNDILAFHQERDRRVAFISALLKNFYLAKILNTHPTALHFATNEYHKPYLSNHEYINVDFNISHSGDYVVLAITNEGKIGIDIEHIDDTINALELAPTVFSSSEQKLIGNDPHKFFIMWTKKEALIKAFGTGFMTDWYQSTNLSLDAYIRNKNYQIYTILVDARYMFSICLINPISAHP